jgi:hypothetical protein
MAPPARWIAGAAGAAALIGLLLWLGRSEPQVPVRATPPNPFADPSAGVQHIEELARRHGANFDQLSNDDRIFLNAIAMGHGRELLAKTARELKAKQEHARPSASAQSGRPD